MRYDVRVTNADGSKGQFDVEQDEPLEVDSPLHLTNMVYRVRSVTPSSDDDDQYDAVVHADWAAGPAQAGFRS